MSKNSDSDIHSNAAVQARLIRLAGYRAMQLRLQRDRRRQIARRRFIALQGDHTWGWLPL